MDRQLKQRVVGAAVLVVLGVIFIPLFLDNGDLDTNVADIADIPPPADDDFASKVVPLDEAEINTLTERTGLRLPPAVESAPQPAPATPPEPPVTPPERAVALPPPATPAPPVKSAPEAAGSPPAAVVAAVDDIPAPRAEVETWTVQLGSFSNDENARKLISKLRDSGYPAYLERSVDGDAPAFKVRVGPQIQRTEAEQVQKKLQQEFALKGMLLRYP